MATPIQREAILQKHVKQFVRDAVDAAHELFAFDRGKASGRFTHLAQAGRGVRKGTPDTQLCVMGFPPIWAELKAPGEKLRDDAQEDIGRRLIAIGHEWFWTNSVDGYRQEIARRGVPLRANAALLAAHHDASVAGVILTAERKRGDAPKPYTKPRAAKPSAALVKRMNALRGRIQF